VVGGELPNYDASEESCTTTLQYLGALEDAAGMEQALGDAERGAHYSSRAEHVRGGLREKCWDAGRGLVADNPGLKNFSQQTNVLAVLFDVVPKDQQQAVLKRVMSLEPGTHPDGVLSCSYYFRFYLARALDHAGMGDDYLASLKPWRELLPMHFSTWPEIPGDTRSDSHAWSAHPAYDLLTLVAGIEPSAPGFASVRVAPHLGELTNVAASFPHPLGMITVQFQRSGDALTGSVTLPEGLSGSFVWRGQTEALHPGVNQIKAD
jgi:alpha-L-rhamnosidase